MNRAVAIIGLGVAAFAVTLALYIGNRLSNEAMSVLTGAACGVGAMLPAAIMGVLLLLRRRNAESAVSPPMQHAAPPYPPVIVVASPNALPAGSSGWQGTYSQGFNMPISERQFSVIGEEEGVWDNEYHSSRQPITEGK